MFKQYVRYADGTPFGVVVLSGNNFGWSICNPSDRFDKRKALLAAVGRAQAGVDWISKLEEKAVNHHGRSLVEVRGGRLYHSRTAAILDKIKYVKEKLKVGLL